MKRKIKGSDLQKDMLSLAVAALSQQLQRLNAEDGPSPTVLRLEIAGLKQLISDLKQEFKFHSSQFRLLTTLLEKRTAEEVVKNVRARIHKAAKKR